MPYPATPTTVTAVYDRWTVMEFRQVGDGLADVGSSTIAPVRIAATIVKWRLREDGVAERSPLPSDRRDVTLDDLYAAAASDPTIAAAVAANGEAVFHMAQLQGVAL